jgi:hypothetical protein
MPESGAACATTTPMRCTSKKLVEGRSPEKMLPLALEENRGKHSMDASRLSKNLT